MPRRARPYAYRDALQWLIDNDDNEWLRDDDPIISVTASLVADIYGRSQETL